MRNELFTSTKHPLAVMFFGTTKVWKVTWEVSQEEVLFPLRFATWGVDRGKPSTWVPCAPPDWLGIAQIYTRSPNGAVRDLLFARGPLPIEIFSPTAQFGAPHRISRDHHIIVVFEALECRALPEDTTVGVEPVFTSHWEERKKRVKP